MNANGMRFQTESHSVFLGFFFNKYYEKAHIGTYIWWFGNQNVLSPMKKIVLMRIARWSFFIIVIVCMREHYINGLHIMIIYYEVCETIEVWKSSIGKNSLVLTGKLIFFSILGNFFFLFERMFKSTAHDCVSEM